MRDAAAAATQRWIVQLRRRCRVLLASLHGCWRACCSCPPLTGWWQPLEGFPGAGRGWTRAGRRPAKLVVQSEGRGAGVRRHAACGNAGSHAPATTPRLHPRCAELATHPVRLPALDAVLHTQLEQLQRGALVGAGQACARGALGTRHHLKQVTQVLFGILQANRKRNACRAPASPACQAGSAGKAGRQAGRQAGGQAGGQAGRQAGRQ